MGNIPHMAQEAFKLQGGGSKEQGAHPNKSTTMEVTVHVATTHSASLLFNNGPTAHWVGPETLVSLTVEGWEVRALADSGSQVNTVTPNFVCQHEFTCSTTQGSGGLPSSFWQAKMATDSQQYTAFIVGNLGFYKFTCMPFGLCNTPATFKHLMQNMLGELSLTYCIIYLNNVIVFGCTEEEHLENSFVSST